MTATLVADVPGFIALLTEQRSLYEKVREAGQQQADMIGSGDTNGLLAVLHERQRLIDALAVLNKKLIPHREAWSRTVEKASPGHRQSVKALLDETQSLLQGILDQDEVDRRELQQRVKVVTRGLDQANQARQTMNAYRPSPAMQTTARFTDQQG